jgi:hypothetical protein
MTRGASPSEKSEAADLDEVEPENEDFNVRRKTPGCGLFLFFGDGDHIGGVVLRVYVNAVVIRL